MVVGGMKGDACKRTDNEMSRADHMQNCVTQTVTPLSHGHATRVIPEFWHSHGHVNPGSTRVEPGFSTLLASRVSTRVRDPLTS